MAAEIEIQGALYSALSALGLTVYDVAPQAPDGGDNSAFPYVEIGVISLAQFDTKGVNGFDFIARIHTRSRSGSMKETKGIQGQIYGRLHDGPLTIVDHRLTHILRERSDVSRAPDGSFHGVCEYRGYVEYAG